MDGGKIKQYINPEQLNELSDKGKKKLVKWLFKINGGFLINDDTAFRDDAINGYQSYALLSIGQMVEFLRDADVVVYYDPHNGKKYFEIIWERDKELADTLWEACKEVLNETN